ncbi:MAG: hypothetical protein OEX03_08970 [Gammaproteobacteria bacterium]|nr:hypothetical protein [Gammaproteobacteria bacterium]
MNQQKVQDCVEALCHSGCDMVRATITAMEAGQSIVQTEGLAHDEADLVLDELKAIMSVYDSRETL